MDENGLIAETHTVDRIASAIVDSAVEREFSSTEQAEQAAAIVALETELSEVLQQHSTLLEQHSALQQQQQQAELQPHPSSDAAQVWALRMRPKMGHIRTSRVVYIVIVKREHPRGSLCCHHACVCLRVLDHYQLCF